MTVTKQVAALAGVLCLLPASAASAATPKKCGDSQPHGITRVVATNIGCATALKVARNYNVAEVAPTVMKGWSCKGRRLSPSREKVRCRKGSRRVTFRSTYQIELATAEASPVANGGS